MIRRVNEGSALFGAGLATGEKAVMSNMEVSAKRDVNASFVNTIAVDDGSPTVYVVY